ncbi:MAG TPA: CHAT domain-containing protein [Thermotogota bacterium]|nr:CHAT domain-containing protein [Thermotogota bacterium]HQQ66486.1 CHAT domain-containing protein [Thermotogota bacterium]
MNETAGNFETLKTMVRERRYHEAMPLCERLLSSATETDRVSLILLKGEIFWHTGEVRRAIATFEEALAAVQERDPLARAEILNNLGVAYREVGQYGEAERSLNKALELLEKNGREPFEQTIHSLNNLGIVKRCVGQYAEAETLYLEAIRLQKETAGVDTIEYTNLLNNLGLLYFSLGMDRLAAKHYEEAADIRRKLVGEESFPFMQIVNNLAAYHHRIGEWDVSEKEYLRVLSFFEKKGAVNHPAYDKTLKNYAAALLQMGRHSEAVKSLEKALTGLSQKIGTDNIPYAKFLSEKGYALFLTGRYPECLTAYFEAYRTLIKTAGPRNFETLSTLSRMSEALLKTGKTEAAYRSTLKVARLQNELLFDMVYTLPEEDMMAFLKTIRKDSDRLLSMTAAHFSDRPERLASTYMTVLLRKGIILEISALRHLFLAKLGGENAPWMTEWREAKTSLARLLYDNRPPLSGKERAEATRKLQDRIKEIEQTELRTFLEIVDIERLKQIKTQTLYETIGEHATILDIYYVEPDNRYLIFILENDTISVKSIDDASALNALILEFRRSIGHGQDTRGQSDMRSVARRIRLQEEAASSLYNAFFSTIPLRRGRDYYLSPDGETAALPFEALLTPTGEYALEYCAINNLTTPKELIWKKTPSSAPPSALFIVDPEFGKMEQKPEEPSEERERSVESFRVLFRDAGAFTEGFARLAGTGDEGEEARQLLERAGWSIEAYLTGKAASKREFLSRRFPKLLHIATHGFFLEQKREGINPLLRSGLVFAGANAGEDSILTAYEVTALDFSRTETVILSACDTGLGETHIGEGLLGFQRAFFARGVKEIVMTLWNISDSRSAELMGEFYAEYARTGSVAHSLRQAKKTLLDRNYSERGYADPYTWAGFVCIT